MYWILSRENNKRVSFRTVPKGHGEGEVLILLQLVDSPSHCCTGCLAGVVAHGVASPELASAHQGATEERRPTQVRCRVWDGNGEAVACRNRLVLQHLGANEGRRRVFFFVLRRWSFLNSNAGGMSPLPLKVLNSLWQSAPNSWPSSPSGRPTKDRPHQHSPRLHVRCNLVDGAFFRHKLFQRPLAGPKIGKSFSHLKKSRREP